MSDLAIWVYLNGDRGRFDALSQARLSAEAIVMPLTMTWHTLPPELSNIEYWLFKPREDGPQCVLSRPSPSAQRLGI